MTTATVADTLASQRRATRETQLAKYANLIHRTAAAGSLTAAELGELDDLLGLLGFGPEDVRRDTAIVERHAHLVKDVAAGGLAEAGVREEREKIAADFKPYSNFQRRTELLAQLDREANALRLRLKTAEGRLSDLANQRRELAAVEEEFTWLVTVPRAAKKAAARKGR